MRQGSLLYVNSQGTDLWLDQGLIGIYNDDQITF